MSGDLASALAALTPLRRSVCRSWWEIAETGDNPSGRVIGERLGLTPDAVSNHISKLSTVGLVGRRPKGSTRKDPAWQGQAPRMLALLGEEGAGWVPEAEMREVVSAVEQSTAQLAEMPPIYPDHIAPAAVGYPLTSDQDRIEALERELAELRRRNEWLTHSSAQEYTGGTMTLNSSDHHFHDKGHLIGVIKNLEAKTLQLIERFKPRRFQGLLNGDLIPGRGIYRNQMLESILPSTEQQVSAGVFRFWEFDQAIRRQFPDLPVEWLISQGNHDFSEGETTCLKFTLGARALGINARFVGSEWIVNLADKGAHNALMEHGYGNSNFTPTSNKMALETYRKVLDYANRGYAGERRIYRVLHGHTHWLNIGLEHPGGIFVDTTGGGHRNDRANIGRNTRPSGWICYISPPGAHDILTPLAIKPDDAVLRADLDNPELEELNRQEAARCVMGFMKLAQEMGILAVPEGVS